MNRASDVLRAGCEILDVVLVPSGFQFTLRDEGQSSGGDFAWGIMSATIVGWNSIFAGRSGL